MGDAGLRACQAHDRLRRTAAIGDPASTPHDRPVGRVTEQMSMPGRRVAGFCVAAASCLLAASSRAADRDLANPPGGSPGAPAGIVIAAGAASGSLVTPGELASLPTVQLQVPAGSGHGPRSFEGPLLWTVLDRAGAVDAGRMHGQVRQTVLVTGRDGYVAVLALGEIAPEFEDKQVIVAERADGRPLGAEHLRLVVPGDRHGGRGVHDHTRIVVAGPIAPR